MQPSVPVKESLRRARRVLYWGLPPLLLYLIFRRIDLGRLGQLVALADAAWVLAGIAMLVPVVLLGALRWHVLLRRYQCAAFPVAASVGEYWKSVAVGLLAPGSLGSDAYRVLAAGRQQGLYLRNAFVIGVEKLAALLACALLVAGLYPLLPPNRLPGMVAQLVDAIYAVFLAGIVCAAVFLLARRRVWMRRLGEACDARLAAMLRRIPAVAPDRPAPAAEAPRSGAALMLSVFRPAVALPTLGLSLAIYLVTAAQAQVLFHAFGHAIPFSINLFVTPLLILLYSLPISFGGLGIREGACILAYGAFGVPAETSLLVSFAGLLGSLASYGIGAGLCLLGRRRSRAARGAWRDPA